MSFIEFTEGRRYVVAHGWPAETQFLLSQKSVAPPPLAGLRPRWREEDSYVAADEITGGGYRRQPAPYIVTADEMTFGPLRWDTGPAEDWPADVRSIAAVTPDGVLLCAWDLRDDGAPRDLSSPDTTYEATPVYRL